MSDKKKIQDFADHIMSFLPLVDLFMEYDIDELKIWLKNMKEDIDRKESFWCMFDMDALTKADIQKLQVNVFEKLIMLIEARKVQIQKQPELQNDLWQREKIAKMMGL